MSGQESKQEKHEVKIEDKKETLLIDVNRSKVEKELADELQKKEAEKQKLNDQLLASQKLLDELKIKDEAKSKEYEDVLKDRDETKAVLQKMAMEKFTEVKTARLKKLQDSGLPEDKIKEFNEKIKGPKDLDEMDFVLNILGEQLTKRQDENAKIEAEKTEKKDVSNPAQANPQNPPKGSQVRLQENKEKDKIYESPREAIDELYARVAKGDKNAEKDLGILWSKFIPTVKNMKTSFSITECPTCQAGIMQGEKCWLCGFDPAKWKASGGEIF